MRNIRNKIYRKIINRRQRVYATSGISYGPLLDSEEHWCRFLLTTKDNFNPAKFAEHIIISHNPTIPELKTIARKYRKTYKRYPDFMAVVLDPKLGYCVGAK